MSKFPELTEAQREPLLALVECQREAQEELRFRCTGRNPGTPFHLYAIGTKYAHSDPPVAEAEPVLLHLWHEQDYIQAHYPDTRTVELILRQKALDYQHRMSKNRFHRWLLDVLDDWATDLRTGVIALAVAVFGTLATAAISGIL